MEIINSLMATTSDENPLKKSFLTNTKYYKEFLAGVSDIRRSINGKELDDLLRNKMQLGRRDFKPEAYLQAATELSVILKIYSIPHTKFKYEKPVTPTSKKNPECTINSGKFIINCEAKCPVLPENDMTGNSDQNTLVIRSAGRFDNFFQQANDIQSLLESGGKKPKLVVAKNKDNTMKDFLKSAHEKFSDLRNEDELNVLFVSLNDANTIQDWCNYLYEPQGLFTDQTFEISSNYSRVDVVVITNLLFRHRNPELINGSAWSLDESFNLLFLNPYRQSPKSAAYSFLIENIRNYSEEMKYYKEVNDLNFFKIVSFVKEKLEEKDAIYLFERKIAS